MTRICTSLIPVALALIPIPAAADPAGDVAQQLTIYADQAATLASRLGSGIDRRYTIADCRAKIASARKAGISADARIRSYSFDRIPGVQKDADGYLFRLGAAHAVCDEYARWRMLAEADQLLSDTLSEHAWLEVVDKATNHEENGPRLEKAAQACASGIDRLVAAGVATDVPIEVRAMGRQRKVTVGQAKAALCDPLATAAASFAAEIATARRARLEKLAAPYKKVGMGGDRLQLMIDHPGYAMYGAGGRELTTPAARRKAKVLFEVTQADDGVYTVRRYAFRGDKLLGVTSKEYERRPGASAYR